MWLGIIAAITEALKLVGQVFGWYLSLDTEMRKEIRAAWDKLQIAEKDGKRADIRSAVNRFNAVD
jgi:hypothetical protein